MKSVAYTIAGIFSTALFYTVLLAYLYLADQFSHEMVVLNGYFTDTYLILYTGCFACFWLVAAGLFHKRKIKYPLLLAGYVLFFAKGVNTFLWEYLAGMTGATYLPGELFRTYALSQWFFYVLLLTGATGIFSIARMLKKTKIHNQYKKYPCKFLIKINNMKDPLNRHHFLILLLGILLFTTACRKDDVPRQEYRTDVYVAGNSYNKGFSSVTLWKNGVATRLSDSNRYVYARSVFVAGDDVYVVGYQWLGTLNAHKGKIWKNGVEADLDNTGTRSEAFDIFVSDGDVYVAGRKRNGETMVATIWKNGVPQLLTDGTKDAFVYSVYVSGKDVYAVGRENTTSAVSGPYKGKIWKNGVAQELEGTRSNQGNALFVSGNDVYVAGFERNQEGIEEPKIWKNGKATNLAEGLAEEGVLHSIYVSGNDVYAAGYIHLRNKNPIAIVLKNGTATQLTNGDHDARAHSVYVMDNDVYVTGYQLSDDYRATGKLWKNGVASNITVPDAGQQTTCASVFVTRNEK